MLVAAAGFAFETGRGTLSAEVPQTTTSAASTSSRSTEVTTSTTTNPPVATRIEDPFHSASLAAYLATRTDNVTAALYNVTTHQTFIYRPGVKQVTASMEKIDILAVLLWESQLHHRALSKKVEARATKMMEYSDNKAAESLWVTIGQLPSVTEFNNDLHFTQSDTSWAWGEFDTTPRDQLKLLKAILFPNSYLNAESQAYEQRLMENVVDYERFGIPTGVPTAATVGVKNGWDSEKATGWQVNTAGYVHLGKTYYLAVVMTGSNPNEDYGRDVVGRVAQAFWNFESKRDDS